MRTKHRYISVGLAILVLLIGSAIPSTNAYAFSKYAGVYKDGVNCGVSAYIRTPNTMPNVSNSGESAWVSSSRDNNERWLQAGCRYYSAYITFKSYVEYFDASGAYHLNEIGIHLTGASYFYKVEYISDDDTGDKWHAYIGNTEYVSSTLSPCGLNVQAAAEVHQDNIQMGPFVFSNVKKKNALGVWADISGNLFSNIPYSASGTTSNFTAYGPVIVANKDGSVIRALTIGEMK